MSQLIHRIVDVETNEITDRPFTDQELKQHQKDLTQSILEIEEQTSKTVIRQSALSKLIDLGLTEEEIAALQTDGKLRK